MTNYPSISHQLRILRGAFTVFTSPFPLPRRPCFLGASPQNPPKTQHQNNPFHATRKYPQPLATKPHPPLNLPPSHPFPQNPSVQSHDFARTALPRCADPGGTSMKSTNPKTVPPARRAAGTRTPIPVPPPGFSLRPRPPRLAPARPIPPRRPPRRDLENVWGKPDKPDKTLQSKFAANSLRNQQHTPPKPNQISRCDFSPNPDKTHPHATTANQHQSCNFRPKK